jgi:hypothetical protein
MGILSFPIYMPNFLNYRTDLKYIGVSQRLKFIFVLHSAWSTLCVTKFLELEV